MTPVNTAGIATAALATDIQAIVTAAVAAQRPGNARDLDELSDLLNQVAEILRRVHL